MKKRRIFVECGYVYLFPELNTGIQRVVRNVLIELSSLSEEYEVEIIPVSLSNGDFEEVPLSSVTVVKKISEDKTFNIRMLRRYFIRIYQALKELIIAFLPLSPVIKFLRSNKNEWGLNGIIYTLTLRPFKKSKVAKAKVVEDLNSDDILLLLDSSWHDNIWKGINKVKKHDMKVICIIYDLIPIYFPQFCDYGLSRAFTAWFDRMVKNIDGYITISKSVEDEVKSYLKSKNIEEQIKSDYFHLGANIKRRDSFNDDNIRSFVKETVNKNDTYIVVSTIEPRKNHEYLLKSFDILWKKGLDIKLCIIGKVGWNNEEFMDKVEIHPMLKKNLFVWNDICDDELSYIYNNSKALLFPSHAEGFGLPIIEGLQNKLPVLASDIPVHHEVGQDNIDYFDIINIEDLVSKIESFEKEGIPERLIPKKDFNWIGWKESSKSLMEKILKMV